MDMGATLHLELANTHAALFYSIGGDCAALKRKLFDLVLF